MSDYTHASKGRRKQRSGPFVALSAALHVGGLSLLMLYSPAREAIFGKPEPKLEPEIRLEGDALANLTEQIRDINREQLMASVMELNAIHAEMEQMRVEKAREFSEVADNRAAELIANLEKVLEQVTTAQKAALEQQRNAADKSAENDELRNAAAQQQSAAEAGQQTLIDILEYAQASESLKSRQDTATAAQVEATRALAELRRAASAARNAEADVKRREEEIAKVEAALANEQNLVQAAKEKLAEVDERVKNAEAEKQEKEQILAAVESEPVPNDRKLASARDQSIRKARDEVRKADGELRRVQQQHRSAAGDLNRREAQAARTQARLDTLNQGLQQAKETLKAREEQFVAMRNDAQQRQEKALELQQASTDALKQALAQNQLEAKLHEVAQRRSLDALRLYESSVGEMYEYLVQAEKEIAQSYVEFRATELALLTQVSPRRAMQQIDIPKPNRPKIDVEITKQKITEGEQYRRHAEVVQTAVRESESIVTAAHNLLDSARRTQARYGEGASVALSERARRLEEINQASHEEQGGQVVDLSHLMRQADSGTGEKGETPERTTPSVPVPPQQIRDVDITAPARKIVTGAPGAKWVYVDSWYTIGPFANPGRANIHRSFPPESSINLDAVYDGMFGPVRWQYIQSPSVKVVPPNPVEYGIWYAYTELAFEQDCDLWIAVGSDDRSDLWINDVKVWSSSDNLKPWSIGEGLRRVHFKKGRNRVLYRIENGWHEIAFSLCIFVGQQ